MAISGDYSAPVYVNGFSCRNCTDVGRAEKNIDPAHPGDGPFGANADDRDPRVQKSQKIFDREKIEAAIISAQMPARDSAYGASGSSVEPGKLVNLSA